MDGAVVAFAEPWQGDVVSNEGGVIRGCSIQQVGDSVTDWIITIDGNDADLGRFSEAIYKKITADAKQQRFQGFRPGTIPPHLEPTYRAFAMDECARETVLEAMQQNDIRPFTDARSDFLIENVSIPPPPPKRGKKKKKGGGKKNKNTVSTEDVVEVKEEVPSWQTYETMKEAIDAGWKPGQSFSFVAKHVKGQKVLGKGDVAGAQPIVKPGLF
eukprot:scaffold5048_cov121-Cylindrotheca_fusiformis.AAC.6